jgi:mono/diheme cytochrome c family protein
MKRFLLIAAIALGSCGKGESTGDPAATAEQNEKSAHAVENNTAGTTTVDPAVAQAKHVFATRCKSCHGPEGRGDGPMSNSLTPRPRDFHSPSFQGEISDDQIIAIIAKGGPAVGKSPTMAPNPDLKPEVLTALKDLIRGFGGAPR